MNTNRKSILFLLLLVLLLSACAHSGEGIEEQKDYGLENHNNHVEELPKVIEQPPEEKENGEKDSPLVEVGEKPETTRASSQYLPPEGSFVLGKFPSPDGQKIINIWGYTDPGNGKTIIDFILWDLKQEINRKFFSKEAGQDRFADVEVLWISEERVLLEKRYLYDTEKNSIRSILPEDSKRLIDISVNRENMTVGVLAETQEGIVVWMLALDTLDEFEITRFSKQQDTAIEEMTIFWDEPDRLVFDGFFGNRAAVYEYDLEAYILSLIHENAKLDQDSKKVNEVIIADMDKYMQAKDSDPQGFSSDKEILAAAEAYMVDAGYQVGNEYDKLALVISDRDEQVAVVSYGFWSSEFIGELILEKKPEEWVITIERQRFYMPHTEPFIEASEYIANLEGFHFGEGLGKMAVGVPYWNQDMIVFLVGEYGKPWQWEYRLAKERDQWTILAKTSILGSPVLWKDRDIIVKRFEDFFKHLLQKEYQEAYSILHLPNQGLSYKDFVENVTAWIEEKGVSDFDFGELRLDQQENQAHIQFWLFSEDFQEIDWYYGHGSLAKNEEQWMLHWPLEIMGMQ